MSYDNPEYDLLAAFKARFNVSDKPVPAEPCTDVLASAQHVYNNAIDVSIDMRGTQNAAAYIHARMLEKSYSTKTWSSHELHPKADEAGTLEMIFTIDLLNFSFWSDDADDSWTVDWKGKRWTGYWALVAALRRAVEDDQVPVTSSDWWQCEEECTEDALKAVFRGCTEAEIPMLKERVDCLREAGDVLYRRFDCSIAKLVEEADESAARLVNLVADNFPCFRDEVRWEERKVRFLKRAQIFVADLWACYEGNDLGHFYDIDKITIFADYRIPQMLHALGCLYYSPPLDSAVRRGKAIMPGHDWEIQLRGCSIWTVELIRREMLKVFPDAEVNAILIDFFLWDTIKERSADQDHDTIPHHKTRSIWY